MNMKQKKHLAIAVSVAATIGLGASTTAQAVDFGASATVENTLTVTNLADFDLGTIFATKSGDIAADGVGALKIAPDGTATDAANWDSAVAGVNLISLGTPVPAQGSVDMVSTFTLTLPDTSAVGESDFPAGGAALAAAITSTVATNEIIELQHFSADPAVPSLYLLGFTVEAVSGGTLPLTPTEGVGAFVVTPEFGATSFVFNIGGNVITEPAATTGGEAFYQPGAYSGTFAVTASY